MIYNLDAWQVQRKARFLKRNKRGACLKTEQTRLYLERKKAAATNLLTVNSIAAKSTGASNSLTAAMGKALHDPFRSKRPPERICSNVLLGTDQNKYFISDREEIKVSSAGRQMFVINKNLKFFKLDAVRRARKSHMLVTQRKHKRFQKFAQQWLAAHVSEQQQMLCNDWLLGKTLSLQDNQSSATATSVTSSNNSGCPLKTKIVLQNDTKKTPYRIYNRYKVIGKCGGAGSNINKIGSAGNIGGSAAVVTTTAPTSSDVGTTTLRCVGVSVSTGTNSNNDHLTRVVMES